MRLPMKITCKWLKRHDACEDQVELFEEVWPEGVVVTEKTLADTAKAGLKLEWFAQRVLSESAYADYEARVFPLFSGYLRQCAPLYTEYQAKCAQLTVDHLATSTPLLTDYLAKDTILLVDYLEERAPVDADYLAKRAPLDAEYQAKQDALLVAALWAVYEKETNHGK